MPSLANQAEGGEAELPAILRDVRMLAQRGSFPVASRRFGELRLEEGRHERLEQAALQSLGEGHRAALQQLAASHARLLRLESACAAALERCACAEYEAAADALGQELLEHAVLERRLNRSVHEAPVRRRPRKR